MKYIFLPFLIILSQIVFAQKLPDVQSNSVFITKPVKIDGKSEDWADTFEAENKRTLIQYTIANDAKNLYLVLKTVNMQNIQKIVNGGVTLSINTEGKRNLKEVYGVSFPIPKENKPGMSSSSMGNAGGPGGGGRSGGGEQVVRGAGPGRGGISSSVSGPIRTIGSTGSGENGSGRGGNVNPAAAAARRDSISRVNYKKTLADSKEIKIQGFKSIQDSTLSIYNEYGVKVAASFNSSGHLVYELAIPLSLLDLNASQAHEFAYQVRINGLSFPSSVTRLMSGLSTPSVVVESVSISFNSGGGLNEVDLFNPAEFWGKYKLVNK